MTLASTPPKMWFCSSSEYSERVREGWRDVKGSQGGVAEVEEPEPDVDAGSNEILKLASAPANNFSELQLQQIYFSGLRFRL